MKNELTKLADRALENFPVTRNYVKKVICVEALHHSTTLAITRLLEIIEDSSKNGVQSRNRKFRECWVGVLRLIAANPNEYVHRRCFCNLGSNDFSLMKYWNLIEPGVVKGTWKITRKGLGFVLGIPGYRYIPGEVHQIGGRKGNYEIDSNSEPISVLDLDSYNWDNVVAHRKFEESNV